MRSGWEKLSARENQESQKQSNVSKKRGDEQGPSPLPPAWTGVALSSDSGLTRFVTVFCGDFCSISTMISETHECRQRRHQSTKQLVSCIAAQREERPQENAVLPLDAPAATALLAT
jgi:hypothetical protein